MRSVQAQAAKYIAVWEQHAIVRTGTLCKKCAGVVQADAKVAAENMADQPGVKIELRKKGPKVNADA